VLTYPRERTRARELTNEKFKTAAKAKTIKEREAATLDQTLKSFQPKQVEAQREPGGVPMGKQVQEAMERTANAGFNEGFVYSSSAWVERPPSAAPAEFLRAKSKNVALERAPRASSACARRKTIDSLRVQQAIVAQGGMKGNQFNVPPNVRIN
jgi:hypothetical protein